MRFCETNVSRPKYINIYEFWGVRGVRIYSIVHFWFIILLFKKTEKIQEHDLY